MSRTATLILAVAALAATHWWSDIWGTRHHLPVAPQQPPPAAPVAAWPVHLRYGIVSVEKGKCVKRPGTKVTNGFLGDCQVALGELLSYEPPPNTTLWCFDGWTIGYHVDPGQVYNPGSWTSEGIRLAGVPQVPVPLPGRTKPGKC